ncbi:hypothetical protein [Geobacillus stearothermophilus]|nr:hypothetical protein [Geobacillus stearothermophilus]
MRKRWMMPLAAICALAVSLCAGCGGQDESGRKNATSRRTWAAG